MLDLQPHLPSNVEDALELTSGQPVRKFDARLRASYILGFGTFFFLRALYISESTWTPPHRAAFFLLPLNTFLSMAS